MPKGQPHEWTLEELQTIWTFDGDEGQTTVADTARGMGVSHSHWYNIRARLQNAGGPEALFAQMQEAKKHRYNRASNGKVRLGRKAPDTVADALRRVYVIRISGGGRSGTQEQFTVTLPPILARAFIAANGGDLEVMWDPRDEGLLLKPVPHPAAPDNLPAWLKDDA